MEIVLKAPVGNKFKKVKERLKRWGDFFIYLYVGTKKEGTDFLLRFQYGEYVGAMLNYVGWDWCYQSLKIYF